MFTSSSLTTEQQERSVTYGISRQGAFWDHSGLCESRLQHRLCYLHLSGTVPAHWLVSLAALFTATCMAILTQKRGHITVIDQVYSKCGMVALSPYSKRRSPRNG